MLPLPPYETECLLTSSSTPSLWWYEEALVLRRGAVLICVCVYNAMENSRINVYTFIHTQAEEQCDVNDLFPRRFYLHCLWLIKETAPRDGERRWCKSLASCEIDSITKIEILHFSMIIFIRTECIHLVKTSLFHHHQSHPSLILSSCHSSYPPPDMEGSPRSRSFSTMVSMSTTKIRWRF